MDFTGEWQCNIHTPLGAQGVRLVIQEVNGVLSGEARGDAETVPMTELSVEGGRLRWRQKVTKPIRLAITFDVGREGEQLVGTAKPGVFPRVKVEGVLTTTGSPTANTLDGGSETTSSSAPTLPLAPAALSKRDNWPSMSVNTAKLGPRVIVGMLVFPGMTALDLIGPHAVLRGPTCVHLIGRDRSPIVSDTGIAIMPDIGIDEAPLDLDVLFVPGGPGQVAVMQDEEMLAFLSDRGSRARYVTSACTGSLILGAAGLLQGYKATTHWAALELLPVFGAEAAPDRVVIDRNRITGGGVTAGIDFGLVLLSTLFGEEVARTTQLLMEYAPSPPFDAGRPETAGDIVTAEALDILAPAAAEAMNVIASRYSAPRTASSA